MYSNLEAVDGTSNHLLVPETLALSAIQADLVRIDATNDAGLVPYVSQHYDLPFPDSSGHTWPTIPARLFSTSAPASGTLPIPPPPTRPWCAPCRPGN